jgi:hypothetical protein
MQAPTDERRKVGGELIIPAAALAFTLYYFSTILDSPWEAQAAAFLIGSILIGLIVAFVVRVALTFRRGAASLRVDSSLLGKGGLLFRRLGLIGLTIGYVVAIGWLGFTLTTFLFLASAMLLLGAGKNRLRTVGLAAAVAFAGYLLFVVAFDTRFPRGPVEVLLGGVFG